MSLLAASGGGSSAVGPTSGGKCYAFNNIGTSLVIVAPANTNRTGLDFYNPGAVNILVAPVSVQALNSVSSTLQNVPLTPSAIALGGCFIVFAAGGSFSLRGECQGAYQAFAASGSNNPFTVLDSNIS